MPAAFSAAGVACSVDRCFLSLISHDARLVLPEEVPQSLLRPIFLMFEHCLPTALLFGLFRPVIRLP